MATLTREQAVWAASVGLSVERACWLLDCPKHTKGALSDERPPCRGLRPDSYLAHINGSIYFRLHRRHVKLLERAPSDIVQARAYRDRRLAELGIVKGAKP